MPTTTLRTLEASPRTGKTDSSTTETDTTTTKEEASTLMGTTGSRRMEGSTTTNGGKEEVVGRAGDKVAGRRWAGLMETKGGPTSSRIMTATSTKSPSSRTTTTKAISLTTSRQAADATRTMATSTRATTTATKTTRMRRAIPAGITKSSSAIKSPSKIQTNAKTLIVEDSPSQAEGRIITKLIKWSKTSADSFPSGSTISLRIDLGSKSKKKTISWRL
jgi:hypothetical protein